MTKSDIDKLSKDYIEIELSRTDDLIDIYNDYNRPKVKIVIDKNVSYLSLEPIKKIQFILRGIDNPILFSFIEDKKIVILNKSSYNFINFLILEFWQGNSIIKKLYHLLFSSIILLTFNYLIYNYSTNKNIEMIFNSMLSAISIFIAIFSIFIANTEQFKNKKKLLFEKEKLAYYFSVDRNITKCGILSIFCCILGLLIVNNDEKIKFGSYIAYTNWKSIFSIYYLQLILLNLSFLFLFITLRSLVEFYVIRPGKFTIGETKDEFLKEF